MGKGKGRKMDPKTKFAIFGIGFIFVGLISFTIMYAMTSGW